MLFLTQPLAVDVLYKPTLVCDHSIIHHAGIGNSLPTFGSNLPELENSLSGSDLFFKLSQHQEAVSYIRHITRYIHI